MKNNLILLVLLLFVLSLLSISIFKNISYPLLWNDESVTVMLAERVLDYGYPKIHGPKNMVYHFSSPIGMNKKLDANLEQGWFQFYFAAIGAFFARLTSDIYFKTAIMRIPFAIIGLAGLMLLALAASKSINGTKQKYWFLISFFFFELLSVPLALHLREVRYYSLIIFFSACIIYIYLEYFYYKSIEFKTYFFTLFLSLMLLFNSYYPAFYIFIGTLFIHRLIQRYIPPFKIEIKNLFQAISPLILSFISAIPFLIFFRTIEISRYFQAKTNFTIISYLRNLHSIFILFQDHFLFLALFLKLSLIILIIYCKKNNLQLSKDNKLNISNLLTFILILYAAVIARNPFYFERYYIVLQPILTLIFLLDGFIIFELISRIKELQTQNNLKKILQLSIGAILIITLPNILPSLNGHIYELTNQYRGPLDYAIPYLKENFKKPEDLVIATNYEETSYMYYLKSKTIVGFMLNNIKEDIKEKPDVLIFRKGWPHFYKIFNHFLKNDQYIGISFPVYDYQFNNLPESKYHLYKTKLAKNERERFSMLIKKETYQNRAPSIDKP